MPGPGVWAMRFVGCDRVRECPSRVSRCRKRGAGVTTRNNNKHTQNTQIPRIPRVPFTQPGQPRPLSTAPTHQQTARTVPLHHPQHHAPQQHTLLCLLLHLSSHSITSFRLSNNNNNNQYPTTATHIHSTKHRHLSRYLLPDLSQHRHRPLTATAFPSPPSHFRPTLTSTLCR